MVLGLLDPDPNPVVRSMDPDPDPSIIKKKYEEKPSKSFKKKYAKKLRKKNLVAISKDPESGPDPIR
jgi:hypothetical protein